MPNPFQNVQTFNPGGYPPEPIPITAPWYRRRNFLVFIAVFLSFSIVGLIYCFSREPVFRSSASLVLIGDSGTSRYWAQPTDSVSNQDRLDDRQHIAVQSRVLTDPHLLQKVWDKIRKDESIAADGLWDFTKMHNMLSVVGTKDSNLIELRAEGHKPEILPILVGAWIETYQSIRSHEILQSASSTQTGLSDQLETLKKEIASKRSQIEAFRRKSNIMSEIRDENPSLTKLTGLNQALNEANQEAIEARTKLESVEEAIARGESVFLENSNNPERLAELEKSAQLLREQLTKLEQQYTPDYIRLVPDLNAVPKQLEAVEAKIASLGKGEQGQVLSMARQESQAAERKVRQLQQQLDDYRQTASTFTARFSEYQDLEAALRNLEKRYRSTEELILQTEVRQHQKYPDIDVISQAYLPQQPIGPDYFRDAGISVIVSMLSALLAVWIANILVPRSAPASPAITLSGIHMYPGADQPRLPGTLQTPQLLGAQPQVAALARPIPEELTESELQMLWDSAPLKAKQLISILFCGITLEEAASLNGSHFDVKRNQIEVSGEHPRSIALPAELKALLDQSTVVPAWRTNAKAHAEDLTALLECLATDADLDETKVSSDSLRHTYLMYLVRQGIRLTELTEIAGYIPPSLLAIYRSQSPRGPGKSLNEIDAVHPLIRG